MTFEIFLACFIGFVVVFVYGAVRAMGNAQEHKQEQKDQRKEIARRALAKGWGYAPVIGREWDWKIHGKTQGGLPWTMVFSIAIRDVYPDGLNNPKQRAFDTINGQQLEWRCPALQRGDHVFSFFRRTGSESAPEVRMEGTPAVWSRWRVESRDEALARRAFSPAVCALLEKLPPAYAKNTFEDQRTSITYGTDGLVSVRGAYFPEPDVVDLWIQINDALAAAIGGTMLEMQ